MFVVGLAVILAALTIGVEAASAATVQQLAAAWGSNDFGQLGNGTSGTDRNKPVGIGGDLSAPDIQTLSGGNDLSLALKSDGTVVAWGFNILGELGNGTSSFGPTTTPVAVSNLAGVKALAGGGNLSLALKTDGTVSSWGSNNTGQLGDGITGGNSNVPVKVTNLSSVTRIAAGGHHSLAK